MIQTGFESRVKVQQIIQNQIPEFILDENPKTSEFLKQYYISQEFQGGPIDIAENLDQYLKLDNLTPEVIQGYTTLTSSVSSSDITINVLSTKGFPNKYGLLKIDNEIITYEEKTATSFLKCARGFSGITDYHRELEDEELVFSWPDSPDTTYQSSTSENHTSGTKVENLSVLFLQEFYKKLKYSITPGLESLDFTPDLNVGNFIKESTSLYQSKGTEESFRILFNVLYGETPKIIDLEKYLIKSSDADYIRREIVIADVISGDPYLLIGQPIIKKSEDDTTSASVSEVEIIQRGGKTYYRLQLFVGYDDSFPTITGNFDITPTSKSCEYVSIGSSVITVDSTVGFAKTGVIYYDDNKISYTDKTLNQFFGCYSEGSDYINIGISTAGIIRSDQIYYGFENGDTSKKVEFRITGVLKDLVIDEYNNSNNFLEDNYNDFLEGSEIFVKNLGEVIKNPDKNKTKKEVFANSWIYNVSSRYQVESFTESSIILTSKIEKSSLKIGDYLEFLERNTEIRNSILSNVRVVNIIGQEVFLDSNLSSLNSGKKYDVRRKIKKVFSSIVPVGVGTDITNLNNLVHADVQNVYSEGENNLYVTSNSLPSYLLDTDIFNYNVKNIDLSSYNQDTKKYSVLEFNDVISFITGDRIYYTPSNNPISGLSEGVYFVEVLSGYKKIRLYNSRTFIGEQEQYIEFSQENPNLPSGNHNFVLYTQNTSKISPQKLLRKFILNQSTENNTADKTIPGPTGMLINGVEIFNYKSNDKIYYGALDSVNILNSGEGYDVIHPPKLKVLSGNALIQPVVSGSFEKIYIDPQEFEIDVRVSIAVTGGNGSGASFTPVIQKSRREIEFDARQSLFGGGLDINSDRITFLTTHNLKTGQPIVYDSGRSPNIGIGSFRGSNADQQKYLRTNAVYYAQVINDKTIQLYNNFGDCISGINTVGFTTVGTSGIQKFKTEIRNTLIGINVDNGGSNYTNRKLQVKQSGISTYNHTINFKKHGFLDGELITYNYQTSPIVGLSSSKNYYVLKVDDDSFRICDAGIGGTTTQFYDRKKYAKFESTGSGYQIFNYPEISVSVTYSSIGIGSTQVRGQINSTPVVKGSIIDAYVYEEGSDYGSKVLNLHKKPTIKIKNGSEAQFKPIILNGRINDVLVLYGGADYYSMPDLEVSGTGSGAILRPIVVNNKVTDVIVINGGSGYEKDKTIVKAISSGKNCVFDAKVRSLTVNNSFRYGKQYPSFRNPANEILVNSVDNLQYYICGFSTSLMKKFDESDQVHSKIIGWAYDGNPIYGPYGYSDPNNQNSQVKLVESSYVESTVSNRPSGFDIGFFVEDYEFDNSGDLDIYNGRFSKTPEFPNGVYAYFTTAYLDPLSGLISGKFPYFIGDEYRSSYISENQFLDQDFDFNNSNLIRNTLPYKVSDLYADNDFIIESNEIIDQKSIVESVSKGKVDSFEVVLPGIGYKVNDRLEFDNSGTSGSGVDATVSYLSGKDITSLVTTISEYDNSVITWKNGDKLNVNIEPYHTFLDGDSIKISGISTTNFLINGSYTIGVTTYNSSLAKDVGNYSLTGIVTNIILNTIPENISVGNSIKIDNEVLSILNFYPKQKALKVLRSSSGVAHTQTTPVQFLPSVFTIDKKFDYLKSELNTISYFNPRSDIGIGTTPGSGITKTYNIDGVDYTDFIPTQSIYLPNHEFKTGQELILRRPSSVTSLLVSDTPTSGVFALLSSTSEKVYAIKRSKDHIGIVTSVGLTTSTYGLYFPTVTGTNSELYNLKSNNTQIVGNVQKIETLVSVSTYHELNNSDNIILTVKPNRSVGIGTTSEVSLKYNSNFRNLLVNSIGISSSGINTTNNSITIESHNFNNGDKVFYNSDDVIASGLSTGPYFVIKVDDNIIKLSDTYEDSLLNTPNIVTIYDKGGELQTLSLLNPPLNVYKNNNLVFNVSDSSLLGKNLKFYYDSTFKKEFVSTGSTNTFSISGVGTVGIGTSSTRTLSFSDNLPEKIYYSLEESGSVLKPDIDVNQYSEIKFLDSIYSGSYSIYGIGSTTFKISLNKIPEKLTYTQNECNTLNYTTNSLTATGGISKVRTISSGSGYKKLPIFKNINSSNGNGAYILPKSNSIGKLNKIRILNEGYEYSSDKTLRPTAKISSKSSIDSSYTIKNINVISGGKNYLSSPDIVIVNADTGEKIDSGYLEANLLGSSINYVRIGNKPKGLPNKNVILRAINNSNGINIETVQSSSSGVVTCFITTPIVGFGTDPFSVGDEVFVEGITNALSEGLGFNSENHGYQFFKIISYNRNLIPVKLEFKIPTLYGSTGVAKTTQDSYATLVNKTNYPEFEVEQEFIPFFVGETIYSDIGTGYEKRDLTVVDSNENIIRLIGNYELSPSEKIRGSSSFNIATIINSKNINGVFKIDFSKEQDIGWANDTGKLNEDNQVIPDNDYYQNLSYTIKSTKEWDTISTNVNSIIHPTGLKNFADIEIVKSAVSGIGSTQTSNVEIVRDFIEQKRVDTINNFDNVIDIDSVSGKTKVLKFKNIKLSDYVECRTNRVLQIDDISPLFSSVDDENQETSSIILPLNLKRRYNRFLIQVNKTDNTEFQLSEVVVINDDKNTYTLQKGLISNKVGLSSDVVGTIGDFSGYIDSFDVFYLKFDPIDPYNSDYNIKILRSEYTTNLTGISTQSVGFIDLIANGRNVSSGLTTSIISLNQNKYSGLYANIEVIDSVRDSMNYVEIYASHDGTDSYMTEMYFDDGDGSSGNFIGSFGTNLSNGIFSLNYTNNVGSRVNITSKVVGFGTTAIGIGTYRFKSRNQRDNSERTARYESTYKVSVGSTEIISLERNKFSSLKSLVKVSYGQTSAIHQVLLLQDNSDVYVTQYPFLSIGSTTGIGTFGGALLGNTFALKFYPDNNITGNIQILAFNESFYSYFDQLNIPLKLFYSPITESYNIARYFGQNSERSNRLNFDLNYQGYPIFKKVFDPGDTEVLDLQTGIFTIENHFFSTGEELSYRPKATFLELNEISVGIGSTLNYLGITTNTLPPIVYPIKISNSQFKLATRKEYALSGVGVTFTSVGEGNAHELEMTKKNERSFITVNNLAQHPLAWTKIYHSLSYQVGAAQTIFALSGISSINPGDVIKADNEFMKITNVGLGTTSTGKITFSGNVPLVQVTRGFVGSSATTHTGLTTVRVYKGSYNIEGNEIFFTDPPRGNIFDLVDLDESNLKRERSSFSGRVFLRKNYTSNTVFDDISDEFTGIGQTFILTSQGINTVGLGTTAGNGLVFINGIFQTPTTENPTTSNYRLVENFTVGITSIVFTGITSNNGSLFISQSDNNQNQLPRGGIIVSLGSTPGLGYAPLVGAAVSVIVGPGGSIVGFGTTGTYGSGYRNPISTGNTIGVYDPNHTGTAATITATVGAGGTLAFNIVGGGSGYVNPSLIVPSPSYEDLSVVGVSRLSVGATTDCGTGLLVNVEVGASSTTGIGSTLFEVTSFKVTRNGYNFRRGDVITPVGLVTGSGLSQPISKFELTVVETFNDSFGSWLFGEMNYIDSIKPFQDGNRRTFPLFYNSELLSFESNPDDPDSQLIDFDSLLMIFINGILQEPKVAYEFTGGTTFAFTTAPKENDNISIFFYVGTRDEDSIRVEVDETLKIGDDVQIFKNNNYLNLTDDQNTRVIYQITGSDRLETNIYTDEGIDPINYKPLYWTKQKTDLIINETVVSKSRDSIESQVYPFARIIKDFSASDSEIFLDNANFFNYEDESPTQTFDCLIVNKDYEPISAGVTATVSAAGTISALTVTNPGYGYTGSSILVKIAPPSAISSGIGSTATAVMLIENTSISYAGYTITNPGSGYTYTAPPQVLVKSPPLNIETITNVGDVEGFDGVITGIAATSGIGSASQAIRFTIYRTPSIYSDLKVGYPIYISNTTVGNGIISIGNTNSQIIGIGTTCLDNIYYINAIDTALGIITCNVSSFSSLVGIATTGSYSYPVGKFSWGRLSSFSRGLSPISIAVTGKTLDVGLTTFASIERRGYGLRKTGALKKRVKGL
jgi:hypothetical protein